MVVRTYVIELALSIYGCPDYHIWQERLQIMHFVSYLTIFIHFMGSYYIFRLPEYIYELWYLWLLNVVAINEARPTWYHWSDRLSAGAYHCKWLAETGTSVGEPKPTLW